MYGLDGKAHFTVHSPSQFISCQRFEWRHSLEEVHIPIGLLTPKKMALKGEP